MANISGINYRTFVKEIKNLESDKKYRKLVFNTWMKNWTITSSVDWFLSRVDDIVTNKEINDKSFLLSTLEKNKWFSQNEKELLKHYLFSQNFIEWPHFFNALRDFINAEFKYLDLVAFKYYKKDNCLRYYWGNKELDMDTIFLDNFEDQNDYINEKLAINDKKWDNFYFKNINTKNDWWKIVFSMNLPWWEQIIVSIQMKETLYDYKDDILKNELERSLSILSNTLLLDTANILLSNIRVLYKDHLTWLYNKSYLEAITKTKKYSISMIDIDSFKTINDTYWHSFWDIVLKKVSMVLKASVKTNDKVCRIWWDEFCILVSTNDQNELNSIIERINKNSKDTLNFDVDNCMKCSLDCNSCDSANKWELKVKLSLGSKIYDWKNSIKELMHLADSNMYDNKSDEWKKERVINQINNMTDYELLSDVYDSVFSKMVEKWWEEKILKDDFIDLLEKRLKLINDENTLLNIKKLIDNKLEL